MENGYSGNNINTDQLLLARGFGIGGYGLGGYGGHGGGSYGRDFASDSSNAVRINAGSALASQGHDFLSQQISDNADRNRDLALSIQSGVSFDRVIDKIADSATVTAANFNTVTREMNENARRAAECCCSAKLQAAENQAALLAGQAQILANQACTKEVASAVAHAELNTKVNQLLADDRGHRGH